MLLATTQSIGISRGELSVFAFWFVVYSGEVFCIAYGMGVSNFTSISTSDQVKYLSIIKEVSPGTDNDRWDLVAKNMNSYLHDEYARKTKDLFFDGKDCFQFFEKRFKPLVTGKVKQTGTASYELVPLVAKAMNVCV
ncbi:hypothetical protein BZL39_B10170 [Zygosaccharomyces parabailii]|nr:hypothetical protein BZL39_B10170 [Zygosaccharomyces parabailii]